MYFRFVHDVTKMSIQRLLDVFDGENPSSRFKDGDFVYMNISFRPK